MTGSDQIRKLQTKVERLERQLRSIPRQHDTQGREFDLVGRNPANAKAGDLANRRIQLYKDTENDKYGLLFKIDGKLIKLEGTEL